MRGTVLLLLVSMALNRSMASQVEDELKMRKLRSLMDAGGVVSKIRDGFNMAGRMLGMDTAKGVANLVSASLMTNKRQEPQPNGVFSAFFRLLGLDSTKLGAIALNALIFIAQLISNSLVKADPDGDTRTKDSSAWNPLVWILDNPTEKVASLLEAAQDRQLPEKLGRQLPGRHTGCVQLLLCKTEPFVWGMQRSVKALLQPTSGSQERWNLLGPLQRMYAFVPSVQEVAEHGDQCESRFPDCKLLPF